MKRILFVCHGNICRSPMAEFVMKDIVQRNGRTDDYRIASAAVSDEETGNPVYPPVRQLLSRLGISCRDKRARRLTADDYREYDLIIAMDRSNLRYMKRMLPAMDKTHLMMEYAGQDRDVADPWYTGDFETCYRDILAGCQGLFTHLESGESHD